MSSRILLKHRHGDLPIRVWVPGCATGEEAYSIAILLLECLQSSGAPPVQIFASDISKQAIQVARDGHYPENIAADVSAERLQKFSSKRNGSYQISKQVRDLCIFAVQDVTQRSAFLPGGSHQLPQSSYLSGRPAPKEGAGRIPLRLEPGRLSAARKLGERGSGFGSVPADRQEAQNLFPAPDFVAPALWNFGRPNWLTIRFCCAGKVSYRSPTWTWAGKPTELFCPGILRREF